MNDLWDVDLDRQVLRTKDRPLASSRLARANAIGNAAFLSLISDFVWMDI